MAVNRSKPDQYQLRFPEGMRERLKQAAEDNSRSMNAEIIARLEASFERADSLQIPEHLSRRIEAAAAANGRTARFEIFRTLVDKYPVPDYVELEEELLNIALGRPLDRFKVVEVLSHVLETAQKAALDY